MSNKLVAVYGSLRKNGGNDGLLRGSEYVGTFKTKPEYTLVSLGGFPGIHHEGTTEVTMEVYSVDEATGTRLDRLEGYSPERDDNTFYDRKTIETPFGDAHVYLYVPSIKNKEVVENGDWIDFLSTRATMRHSY